MRVFLPAVALTAASLSLPAQTTAAPTAPVQASPAAPAADPGMATYRNDTLHLSYSYPSTYADASTTVGPAFEASIGHADASNKDLSRCVTLPFSVMSGAGGQIAVVLLVRADAGCMKKAFTAAQLPEFTKGEVVGLTASGAHTQFDEPVAFTTQGHSAELLHGTFELPTGQTLHAEVVCMLLNPDVACWQFLASSEQGLHTMSAFPVKLEGGQSGPLVPPTVVTKPQ